MVASGMGVKESKNTKKDAAAEDKIAECFPGREIISMMAKDLVTEGGAFHCISMHQPK